ncbi:hypothetical protein J7L29_03295 [Candidatus Bathyarchaeota archaeon]|nr:hypothetical protein [Candidatus Bathyarchaeota archaeon]
MVERVGILIVFCALDSVAGQRIHEKLRLQGQPEHADEREAHSTRRSRKGMLL